MTYLDLLRDAVHKLDKGDITLGEYDRMLEPLNREIQPERKTGRWAEIHGNKNMRICQSCGFMVNKSLLYDYTKKDPLVFKYCPSCGSYNGEKEAKK